jgi:hypothetical protein
MAQHPFGPELAQVREIAEEYGLKERLKLVEREENDMVVKGLLKFSGMDYQHEIQSLYNSIFGDESPLVFVAPRASLATTSAWI